MSKTFIVSGLVAFTSLALAGCGTTKYRSEQIARVAKDWSQMIRASQVIPVYPLTEDLLPGDVFLVQSRIEDQISLYEKKGFLPLDQLLVRLQPTNYAQFYLGAYGINGHTNTPYHWTSENRSDPHQIDEAPRAAFPTYSFAVSQGAGLNLAIPVEGVPVALNLMRTASAHGTIVIDGASTYGIDMFSMRHQVEHWGLEHSTDLAALAPTENRTNYLRIVTRVFRVERANISVFNDEATGVAASAGAGNALSLPNVVTNDSATNLRGVLDSVNASVESAALPGGALKLVAASRRTVSLTETFPKPLAIGYLGFDMPILTDGRLGVSVPTQARLTKLQLNPIRITVFGKDENSEKIERWINNNPKNRDRLRTWLDQQGFATHGLTNVILGKEDADLRVRIVGHFQIK